MNDPILFMPTREQVQSLKVGDSALNCFGEYAEVVEIYGRGDDINGKAYVCFYVRFGDNASMSEDMKEGEIVRHLGLCKKYLSAEIDVIERQMRKERETVSSC